MATTSKKTPTSPAAKTPVAKAPAAKKTTTTPEIKPAAKKTAVSPAKKAPVAAAIAPTKAAPAKTKKVSAPKAEKPVTPVKSATNSVTKKTAVSAEERYHMIATAAYFRAEHRGFVGGYEMQDWIASEAQIDASLKA
jgi:hypothetical protein